jgi:lipopolysaccharide transport system ATP-binding protein
MQDISTREGRTVLFVSHNMAAVSQLCDRCLVLNGGKIQVDDKTAVGVASYLRGGALDCAEIQWEAMEAPGGESMRLRRVRLCQPPGVPNASINLAEAFEVEIETEVLRLLAEAAVGIKLLSAQGQILLHTFDLLENQRGHLQPGLFVHVCTFPAHLLNAGSYSLTVAADIPHVQVLFVAENILSWRVHNFTEKVSRYGSDAFKGFIGPGLAQWRLSDKIVLTHEE